MNAAAYRSTETTEPLRPPGVVSPRTLEETCLNDAVTLTASGELTEPKIGVLHAAMAVVVIGPPVAAAIGIALGAIEPALIAVALVFTTLFGWVWRRTLIAHRAGALLNAGRIDEAERLVGQRGFGTEVVRGIVKQLRSDHVAAAQSFRAAVITFERRPGLMQPVHAQSFAREAIALVNVGRLADASARLQAMPRGGRYLQALAIVASSYLAFAAGESLPIEVVRHLEKLFTPIRGSWGGLALAAYGYHRLGDAASRDRLLAEERRRVNVEHLGTTLPLLERWTRGST